MLSVHLSHRNSVRPSVCLFVTRVDQAKTPNAKIGIFYGFSGDFGLRHKNHSQGGATVLALVACAFRLKRSYSTPGPVSIVMGDCLRAGTAIGFHASHEH